MPASRARSLAHLPRAGRAPLTLPVTGGWRVPARGRSAGPEKAR
jgi:hypothetical protein